MAGDCAIYTVTSAGQTEANDANRIEIEGNASVPDAKTRITYMKPRLGKRRTDQGNSFSNNVNNPDTGPLPPQVEIGLIFDERTGTSLAKTKLRDKFFDLPNDAFPKGRIGWRNDKDPTMNLVPSSGIDGAGYKIISFEYDNQERFGGYIPGVLVLELGGKSDKLKTGG